MKYLFIILIVFSFSKKLNAQAVTEKQLDSMKNAIDRYHKQDSVLAEMILDYAGVMATKNPNEALKINTRGGALASKVNWQRGSVSALQQKGAIYQELGDFQKAADYLYRSLKGLEAMKGYPKDFIERSKGMLYLNISVVFTRLNQTAKSIFYIKKSIQIFKKHKEDYLLSGSYLNAGNTYLENNLIESEKYLDSAFSIAKKNEFANVLVRYYINKGKIRNRNKKYIEAIDFFNSGEKYILANDMASQLDLTQGRAESNLYDKKYKEAEKYFLQANELAKKYEIKFREFENSEHLSTIYENLGDKEKALKYYKHFILLRDSTIGIDKKIAALEIRSKFEADKKEAIAKAEIRNQKKLKNYSIIGVLILLLGAIAIFVFYKKHRDSMQKQNELLYKAKVADTDMRILRLQMNPHFIFNSLNSISDYISKNDIQNADYYLSKFAKLMRGILENSEEKEIPLADELKMLELYMQLEGSRLNYKFTYEIKISDDVDPEITMVPPLILQPFVENSIWHGLAEKDGGGKITIEVTRDNSLLNCIVEDNGVGRKEAKPSSGKSYGMKITKDRIELLNKLKNSNASINLIDLEKGTRVEVKLPFETEV